MIFQPLKNKISKDFSSSIKHPVIATFRIKAGAFIPEIKCAYFLMQ